MKRLFTYALHLGITICVIGCTTITNPDGTTTNQFDKAKAEKIAARVVTTALIAAAQTYANGGQIDSAWAISTGMNSLAGVVADLNNQQAAALIQGTAVQFSGDSKMAPVAQKLANAYLATNPQTPAQKTATVVALASGVQTGTQNAINALP